MSDEPNNQWWWLVGLYRVLKDWIWTDGQNPNPSGHFKSRDDVSIKYSEEEEEKEWYGATKASPRVIPTSPKDPSQASSCPDIAWNVCRPLQLRRRRRRRNLSVRSSPISTHLQRKLTIKSLIYWSDQQTTSPVNGRIWRGSQRLERKKCISISHTKVILQFYVQRFSSGGACTRRLWFASYVHVQHLFIICWPSTWTWTGIEI